jgi:hypothetical protein
MSKKSNFEAKILYSVKPVVERLIPFLIIATSFVWLWR